MSNKYYDGHFRLLRDGVPCRVASWVKDLSPISRSDMLRNCDPDGLSMPLRKALSERRYAQTIYIGAHSDMPDAAIAIAAE